MTRLRLGFLLCVLAVARVCHAGPDPEYDNYVADVYLLESQQWRSPEAVIRYADGKNGELLKSVLDPVRAKRILAVYTENFAKRGPGEVELPKLLGSVISRYDKALVARGSLYENEYLDAAELSTRLAAATLSVMQRPSNPIAAQRDGRQPTADERKMMDGLNSLAKSLEGLIKMTYQQQAASIRKKVDEGKFSPQGAQRALALATSLGTMALPQRSVPNSADQDTNAPGPRGDCTVSVLQDGRVIPRQMLNGVPGYALRGAPFRIEVSSSACEPSIGVFLATADFKFVAGSTLAVTVAGFEMAGSGSDDVLIGRSEDPRLVPPFENMFDGTKAQYDALCEQFSKCPLKIRAHRTSWPFTSDGEGTRRSFAAFSQLTARAPLLGTKGEVPVVVYTNVKPVEQTAEERNAGLRVLAVHPFVLRFQ